MEQQKISTGKYTEIEVNAVEKREQKERNVIGSMASILKYRAGNFISFFYHGPIHITPVMSGV